jgi:hypothetical protein
VLRVQSGGTVDFATSTACTNTTTNTCIVNCTTAGGTQIQKCTDTDVATSPAKYDYLLVAMASPAVAESIATASLAKQRITVPIPPDNMILVNRESVNYEMCSNLGQTPDHNNKNRCVYTGYGATKGLTDAFEELRNITQDIGTSIGQFWLTPLTKSLEVLNTMLGQAAKLSGVFTAGGALAGVGGVAMGGAGSMLAQIGSFLAPAAAINWLRRSKGFEAFREGFGSARGGPMGEYNNRYLAGTQGHFERAGYALGSNLGFISPGTTGAGGRLSSMLGLPARLGAVAAFTT